MEIPPCLLLEVADEGRAVELGGGGVDDVELREQTIIEIVVVLDGITEVKNGGLDRGHGQRHGGDLHDESERLVLVLCVISVSLTGAMAGGA